MERIRKSRLPMTSGTQHKYLLAVMLPVLFYSGFFGAAEQFNVLALLDSLVFVFHRAPAHHTTAHATHRHSPGHRANVQAAGVQLCTSALVELPAHCM